MVQGLKIDYEAMVHKYMNEWQGKNLRGFCYEEKVNIYRMLKTMKRMGFVQNDTASGIRPLCIDQCDETDNIVSRHFSPNELRPPIEERSICDVKISNSNGVVIEIKECKLDMLLSLLRKMEVVC